MDTPLQKAVRVAGGLTEFARQVGVKYQSVQYWLSVDRVPPEHVLAVESVVGGEVTRYDLRPDVYGPAPREAA